MTDKIYSLVIDEKEAPRTIQDGFGKAFMLPKANLLSTLRFYHSCGVFKRRLKDLNLEKGRFMNSLFWNYTGDGRSPRSVQVGLANQGQPSKSKGLEAEALNGGEKRTLQENKSAAPNKRWLLTWCFPHDNSNDKDSYQWLAHAYSLLPQQPLKKVMLSPDA